MDIKQFVRIKLGSDKEEDILLSKRLAKLLSLPPPASDVGITDFFFQYHDSILELYARTTQGQRSKPLTVDFLSAASLYRHQFDRRISQPLAKAVGIKRGVRPYICDVTAGFGSDGFVLASLDCKVTLIERSPLIWALLEDGIRRAEFHPKIGTIFKERVSLNLCDSITFITTTKYLYDTIYMDPMYPHRKKSALNKLRMRLLRNIVGDDIDSSELLKTARLHAKNRVVVKRPGGAPFVGLEKPSYSVNSKSSRYDIYLTT